MLLAGGLATCGMADSGRAAMNNNMFPPPPAVAKSIAIDSRGFIINGRRTFIASGSLHYARVPRALWANRLLRMKRAGFNTVST
ncbi:Glycoside hydrolase, family 35, partial [mine drainage metagenome]